MAYFYASFGPELVVILLYPHCILFFLSSVDSIRYVRPDSIVVGCDTNDDSDEATYLVQVITSKDKEIIDVGETLLNLDCFWMMQFSSMRKYFLFACNVSH